MSFTCDETNTLMIVNAPPRQRGQATTEFIVSLFVLIPLFFGVFYFARYADVKRA